MKVQLFTALVLALVTPAAGGEDRAREELARLQGVWRFVKNDALPPGEGRNFSEWMATYLSMVIKGNAGEVREEQFVILRFHLAIDPTRTPKTIDVTIDYFLPEADPQYKDVVESLPPEARVTRRTIRAIYSLEGEILKVCTSAGGKERLRSFADPKSGVLTLRRAGRKEGCHGPCASRGGIDPVAPGEGTLP
jgi:uncharacterized protein (TIGR03067 family)